MKHQICQICPSALNKITIKDIRAFGTRKKSLGQGAYGSVGVYESQWYGKVAIKTINTHTELQGHIIRELSCLLALKGSPYIIDIYAWTKPNFVDNLRDVNIVLELGQMDLSKAIKQQLINSEIQIQSIMKQLISGVFYMHSRDIWHRDLKTNNIIVKQLNPEVEVKIADFGLARAGPFCNESPTTTRYTLWYRAPEILIEQLIPQEYNTSKELIPVENENKKVTYDLTADTWALGIVFWDLIAGLKKEQALTTMFRGSDEKTQLYYILAAIGGTDEISDENKNNLSDIYFPIKSLFEYKREPTISTYVKDAFHNKLGIEFLIKMLQFNPTKRPSSLQMMNDPYINQQQSQDECFVRLESMQQFRRIKSLKDETSCFLQIPGESVEKKFTNYNDVATQMIKFVTLTNANINTFPLAIELLHCLLTQQVIIEDYKRLLLTAYTCLSLASKFYSTNTNAININLIVKAFHDEISYNNLAQFEVNLYEMIGGNLILPTAYRILIELVGCPITSANKRFFAECVTRLFCIQTTRATFVGSPSEIAKLAVQLTSNYEGSTSANDNISGCAATYKLSEQEFKEGAELVLQDLQHFDDRAKKYIIEAINKYRIKIESHTHEITFDDLLSFFKVSQKRLYKANGDDETTELVTTKKEKLQSRKRERNDDDETEEQHSSLLSPEIKSFKDLHKYY